MEVIYRSDDFEFKSAEECERYEKRRDLMKKKLYEYGSAEKVVEAGIVSEFEESRLVSAAYGKNYVNENTLKDFVYSWDERLDEYLRLKKVADFMQEIDNNI